ncbi:MAG: hypothetical protein ABI142_06050 [Bryocella sp.]
MPYRLDLTVSVLRRLSTNIVDRFTPEGQYVRVFSDSAKPIVVRATQAPDKNYLTITIENGAKHDSKLLALTCQMLGVDRDITGFTRSASHIPWLTPLVTRMRGVKPPRYPTLWEACANAIVFQQVSLRAASAIMERLILTLAQPVEVAGLPVPCFAFPSPESFQRAADNSLHAAGLSRNKVATLRSVAEAIASGTLDEAALERSTSPDVATTLCRIKGIGPWTATVVLLRGLGRLDVFPDNDTSVAKNLALIPGSDPLAAQDVLNALGAQRGMLYYHLLLARLEARGTLGSPSFER